jgi:2-(1,2-epoxy-1,2-dihydrophenyl)acetyl-CoA isomerase
MERQLLCSVERGIARICFNRPEHANSFGLAAREDMTAAVQRVCAADVRVVLITGSGKYFCAGGDIGEFQEKRAAVVATVDAILQFAHPLIHTLATLPVPVISAINGAMAGGGIGLGLCADFVLASDAMKLRGGYCALGLSPDLGASYFLTQRVGIARAKSIFMRNRSFSAAECLQMGIVDELYPAHQLEAAVTALAEELAAGPSASFGRVKALCNGAAGDGLKAHLDREHVLMLQSASSADFQDALAALSAKRPASTCQVPALD